MTEQIASQIHESLPDSVEMSEEAVAEKVNQVRDMLAGNPSDEKVKMESERAVANQLGINRSDFSSDSTVIENLVSDNYYTVEFEVVREIESDNESIGGLFVIGDNTGTTLVTQWEDNDNELLTPGETYKATNLAASEYDGDVTLSFTQNTSVEEIDAEFDVPDQSGGQEMTIEGNMVKLLNNSGLIKRCPIEEDDSTCGRVVNPSSERCSEHGEVEPEYDLRIKAVLDNGHETYDLIIGKELTEELTGITLEEAKEMAVDAMNLEVVADEIRQNSGLFGRYYTVKGQKVGTNFLVEEIEENTDSEQDIDDLLIKARSM